MPFVLTLRSAVMVLLATSACSGQTLLFHESFDDTLFKSRGWYDGRLILTAAEHYGAAGQCAEYHFTKGARTGVTGSGIRHLFAPTDSVCLRYYVKYSASFVGSGKPYHPHEFHFVTTEDDVYVGPARTHLTTYIEENAGTPLLAIQDGSNIDETKIGVDLTDVTEARAVAGCNGSSDDYPAGDCYLSGAQHFNGKQWKAPRVCFTDTAGPYFKNAWHRVDAFFKLNSIAGGKGVADGVVQYWFDGESMIDHRNVMIRTATHPTMQFNQLLIAPYIGDGSPVDQTMWVDEVTVSTGRMDVDSVTPVREGTRRIPAVSRVEIVPNPSCGTTAIQWDAPQGERVVLCVVDALGRTLVRERVSNARFECDTRILPCGLYTVTVASHDAVVSRRLVVVR